MKKDKIDCAHAGKLHEDLTYLFCFAGSINLLFGFLKIVNSLRIGYYFFHRFEIIEIFLFSPLVDWVLYFLSLSFLIAYPFITRLLVQVSIPQFTVLSCVAILTAIIIYMAYPTDAFPIFLVLGGFATLLSIYMDAKNSLALKRSAVTILFFLCIICVLIPIELGSVVLWIANAYESASILGPDPRLRLPLLDLQLFYSFYPATIWMLLIFLTYWVWLPILRKLNKNVQNVNSTKMHNMHEKMTPKYPINIHKLTLVFSILAGMFLAYYPFFQTESPALVGVDSSYYQTVLKRVNNEDVSVFFQYDRPMFHLVLFGIQALTGQSPQTVLVFMPMITVPFVSISAYLFVITGTGNEELGALVSVFSTFSFHTIVGMYAYIIANWFALAIIFTCLTYCMKFWANPSIKNGFVATLTFLISLFTHPYSWMALLAILVGYALFTMILHRKGVEGISDILYPIALLAASLILFIVFPASSMVDVTHFFQYWVNENLAFPNIVELYIGLSETLIFYVGGFFANWLIYLLATLGMVFSSNLEDRFNRIINAWVIFSSIALIITTRGQDIQWRELYIIPFQIPAAIGLYNTLDLIGSRLRNKGDLLSQRYFIVLRKMLILIVILSLFNYSLRSLSHVFPQSM